jgi:hypothetical protein
MKSIAGGRGVHLPWKSFGQCNHFPLVPTGIHLSLSLSNGESQFTTAIANSQHSDVDKQVNSSVSD